jgi:hypothetical protein
MLACYALEETGQQLIDPSVFHVLDAEPFASTIQPASLCYDCAFLAAVPSSTTGKAGDSLAAQFAATRAYLPTKVHITQHHPNALHELQLALAIGA